MEFSMKIWIVAMNGRWTNDDDDSDEDRAMHALRCDTRDALFDHLIFRWHTHNIKLIKK